MPSLVVLAVTTASQSSVQGVQDQEVEIEVANETKPDVTRGALKNHQNHG